MGRFRDLWDRSRDGDRKEQRSFVRYAIVATLVCVLFLCVKKDSLITWIGAGVTLNRQHRQVESYEKENAALRQRIESLTTDRDSLETFARERLQFAAPGDDVYIIPE